MMGTERAFRHNGMPFSVQIVGDSLNRAPDDGGNRITTFVLKYPRFIHAQMMTHRCLSRNAQSSRAMPVKKLLATEPVIPTSFGKNVPGMQPGEALDDRSSRLATAIIEELYEDTAEAVQRLVGLGVHKQWANRYLEPFTTITAIYTGTDDAWASVFALRCHPDAQEEIQVLMNAVKEEYEASAPLVTTLHIPFMRGEDKSLPYEIQKVRAVARCARVSYLNFDGGTSFEKDKELYNRLLYADPPHMSPFEHVASSTAGTRHANFKGWMSLRKQLGR